MRKLTPDRNKTAKFDDIGIDNLIDCVCELLENSRDGESYDIYENVEVVSMADIGRLLQSVEHYCED